MKYPRLSAAVPEGEHFDESVVNEGVWLTVAHVNSIEAELNTNSEAAVTIAALELEIAANETSANQAAATNEALAARVVELEAELEVFGKTASGTGSKLIAGNDKAIGEEDNVPSYLDANNPINQFADSKMRKRK